MKKTVFRRSDLLKILAVVIDFISFQTALVIGYLLWVRLPWHGNWQYFSQFSMIMWILPPVAVMVFKSIGLYKPGMGVIGVQEQSLIFKAIWIIYFAVFALSFFYRDVTISRLAMLYSMIVSLFLISVERYFMRRFVSHLNQKGLANRKAIIYGAGYHGVRLERWIRQTPHLGIHVLGYLDDEAEVLEKKPEKPAILGDFQKFHDLLDHEDISIVFIAHRTISEEKVVEIIQTCRDEKIDCWVIPSLYKFRVEQVEVQHIGGIPLIGFKHQFARRSYEFLKHVLDRVVALVLLLISAPLWLLVGFSVYFTSGKPIFFKQIRVGKQHKKFWIYKFRTMHKSTEDGVSPELQGEKSVKKRITPLGHFLRRTGLDEIPQLWNIVSGEMSLVGPRPEMPFLVSHYGPLEKERLTVKPGVTGLWQISHDRKRLLIHENMDYDLYYVEHMSFNLDLAILVKTFFVLLGRFKKEKKEG